MHGIYGLESTNVVQKHDRIAFCKSKFQLVEVINAWIYGLDSTNVGQKLDRITNFASYKIRGYLLHVLPLILL